MLRILHLEDNALDAELVHARLRADGLKCDIERVMNGEDFQRALSEGDFDLIISDFSLPTFDGATALELARAQCPHKPFLFVSGTMGEDAAIACLKLGATDYILKHQPERLTAAVRRALEEASEKQRLFRAEEELREKAALLDQAHEAICVTDLGLLIRYWNKGAERLYGWSAGEAVGRSLKDLVVHGDLPVVQAAMESLIRENGWNGEMEQVTRDNRRIVVENRWVLTITDERPKAILMIGTDITEKKQIEAQLLRNQRMHSLGALASGIAHDLNNVLSPIMMGSDMLHSQLQDEGDRRILEMLRTSARRGTDLVKQILSFASGALGERQLMDIKHLLAEIRRLAESTFPQNITISSVMEKDLLPIVGNATQLHQVLLNLCVNARDAMPHGGPLRIEASNARMPELEGSGKPATSYVVISVKDAGVGIPPNRLKMIFEPFYTTKEAGKGTGLGLSTVKTIAEQHGGFIRVESEVGAGTTFQVYLPAQKSDRDVNAGTTAMATMPVGHGEFILVVDDETAVLEITKTVLETFQYRVLTANHGAKALHLFQQNASNISLVITDMSMPVVDGLALIRMLRNINPSLPVIPSSGVLSTEREAELRALGLTAFLIKPFAPDTLLRTLRQVLDAKV